MHVRDFFVMKSNDRVHFVDLMRGFAVIVMVMGHTIDSVLSNESRTTELFRLYDAVRGFTAPVFLFVAGMAFMLVTQKKWALYKTLSPELGRRVLKILLLLVVGYALHFPFFSFTKLVTEATTADLAMLFQVDVLHCVAASLLILQLMVVIAPSPRVFTMALLGVTAAGVLLTPPVWGMDFASILSPALAPYFNQQQISIFPLFPFAGFVFGGAVAGYLFLSAQSEGRERQFFTNMLRLSILAAVCGIVFDLLPVTVYPPHDYWKSSPDFFLVRMSIVLLLTAAFFFMRRVPEFIARHVVVLGKASLLVYVVHLIAVYGSVINSGLAQAVGRVFTYPEAALVGFAMLGAMTMLVRVWNFVSTRHLWSLRIVQVTVASTLLFFFFTKPF